MGNTVRANTGYGLNFTGTESAYSENVLSNNTAGLGGTSCSEYDSDDGWRRGDSAARIKLA